MKTTAITALILAIAPSAFAAPTAALKPIEITTLTAGIYSDSRPETTLFNFEFTDPNHNVETSCSSYWSAGQAGNKTYECVDKAYQLRLTNGIYNIENFEFEISRVDGSETGLGRASGDAWKCKKQEAPLEQCKWDGILYLKVAPSA